MSTCNKTPAWLAPGRAQATPSAPKQGSREDSSKPCSRAKDVGKPNQLEAKSQSAGPPPPPPPDLGGLSSTPGRTTGDHGSKPAAQELEEFDAKAVWLRAAAKAKIVGRGLAQKQGDAGAVLTSGYHMEKLDHRHRDKTVLNRLYNQWTKNPEGERDFYTWLKKNDAKLSHAKPVKQFHTYGERAPYHARVGADGTVDMIHDTNREFVESYTGELIFAMSHANQLFVGLKSIGSFHHSTFLAGDAVKCAGTFGVKDGRITSISDHSGHYKPTIREVGALVKALGVQGLNPEIAEIEVVIQEEAQPGGLQGFL